MTTISGSPEALRASARTLAGRSGDLRARAAAVRAGAATAGQGWQGTASVAFLGRAQEASRELATTGEHLGEIAAATERFAGQLDAAQHRVQVLSQQRERGGVDLSRARLHVAQAGARHAGESTGAGTGDGSRGSGAAVADATRRTEAVARRAVSEAEQHLHTLAGSIDDVVGQAAARARQLQACLEAWNPGSAVPAWASGGWVLGQAAQASSKALRSVWQAASFLNGLGAAHRALRAGDIATYIRHSEQAGQAIVAAALGKGRLAARSAGRLPAGPRRLLLWSRRLSPWWTAAEGAAEVWTGGGYGGWRGGVTRGLGGAGALGGVVLASGLAGGPITMGAAGLAVTGYLCWKAGNFAYDHRHQIAAFASTAWRGLVSISRVVTAPTTWALKQAGTAIVHPVRTAQHLGHGINVGAAKGGATTLDTLRKAKAKAAHGARALREGARRLAPKVSGLGRQLDRQLDRSIREPVGPFSLWKPSESPPGWRTRIRCTTFLRPLIPPPACRTQPTPAHP